MIRPIYHPTAAPSHSESRVKGMLCLVVEVPQIIIADIKLRCWVARDRCSRLLLKNNNFILFDLPMGMLLVCSALPSPLATEGLPMDPSATVRL